jgi:hypothetical protein
MGAHGFNVAEEGAVVPLYTPIDIDTLAAAKSPVIVLMKNWVHASIIYSIGQLPRVAGVVTIESCSNVTPTVATAIMFPYYRYETSSKLANGDVHGALTWTTTAAAGLIPVAGGVEQIYVIELDADMLVKDHIGFRMCIADPAAASVGSAIAILSGARYADKVTTNMAVV